MRLLAIFGGVVGVLVALILVVWIAYLLLLAVPVLGIIWMGLWLCFLVALFIWALT